MTKFEKLVYEIRKFKFWEPVVRQPERHSPYDCTKKKGCQLATNRYRIPALEINFLLRQVERNQYHQEILCFVVPQG